jgi:hypothetical protein
MATVRRRVLTRNGVIAQTHNPVPGEGIPTRLKPETEGLLERIDAEIANPSACASAGSSARHDPGHRRCRSDDDQPAL